MQKTLKDTNCIARDYLSVKYIVIFLLLLALLPILSPQSRPWLIFIFESICIVYFLYRTILFVISAIYHIKQKSTFSLHSYTSNVLAEDLDESKFPNYTILTPLYKENEKTILRLISSLSLLVYPVSKLEIFLLIEESDLETQKNLIVIKQYIPKQFRIVTVPEGTPKNKPRACNYGLYKAKGEYITIYDAEDYPDNYQLLKVLDTFNNPKNKESIVCVQCKLNYYNYNRTILTRLFSCEYSLLFEYTLPAFSALKMAFPLGGTSNHFKVSALKALGGWDKYNVTEDADIGMKIGWLKRQAIECNSITLEESPQTLRAWIIQRSRWLKGYLVTFVAHFGIILSGEFKIHIKARNILNLILFIGFTPIIYLVIPILIISYFIGEAPRIIPASIMLKVFISYFVTSMIMLFLLCYRYKNYLNLVYCLLFPVYFLLGVPAVYIALVELIISPYFWHKSNHSGEV